jgi:hypothetical protein
MKTSMTAAFAEAFAYLFFGSAFPDRSDGRLRNHGIQLWVLKR